MTDAPAPVRALPALLNAVRDWTLCGVQGGPKTIEEVDGIINLCNGDRFLEVACAALAPVTLTFAYDYPHVTFLGLDADEAAIHGAEQAAEALGVRNTIFMPNDIVKQGLRMVPARSQRVVWLGGVLAFVDADQRVAAIQAAIRVLRTDGWLIAVPMFWPQATPPRDVQESVGRLVGTEVHNTLQYWRDLFTAADPDLREVKCIEHEYVRPTEGEIANHVQAVMASCVDRFEPAQHARYTSELMAAHTLFAENNTKARFAPMAFRLRATTGPTQLLVGQRID